MIVSEIKALIPQIKDFKNFSHVSVIKNPIDFRGFPLISREVCDILLLS